MKQTSFNHSLPLRHDPPRAQWLHEPPQEDFPFFLSFLIERIASTTMQISIARTNTVGKLPVSHVILKNPPFCRAAAETLFKSVPSGICAVILVV